MGKKRKRCEAGHCVVVEETNDGVEVSDSKDPHGPRLQFTEAEWREFLARVKGGDFD